MALSRRSSHRMNNAIWPGFVDAMTGLLLVLMFVLTIFMVIQFVLRETISGQASQLDELAAEISVLASALGLEQDASATLTTTLETATETVQSQAAAIALLTNERDDVALALVTAQNQITGFEAQVAGLLSQRSDARVAISDLEAERVQLLSDQDALNIALANARGEIDASVQAARLAAARREALEALIADLEHERGENIEQISDLEAARLVDAAAAEALRDRLQNADTELTAMTLSLEEQRRHAEETLTLLAAADAARENLDTRLALALLAGQKAESDLTDALSAGNDLDVRLLAALELQTTTAEALDAARLGLGEGAEENTDLVTRLAAAIAANNIAGSDLQAIETALQSALNDAQTTRAEAQERLAAALLAQQALRVELVASSANQGDVEAQRLSLEERLAEAFLTQQALQAQVDSLSNDQDQTQVDRTNLQARLAEALARVGAEELRTQAQLSEAERQAALLASANAALSSEEALSAESQRQVALLNQQVSELRRQVGSLQELLGLAEQIDLDANVQITALGTQLNTALARVAAEERRRRALEEAARIRLQAEAQNLERFRSEFFGQLRDLLEGQDGVRVVGDRFVFSSEVLFQPGQAELSQLGQAEIAKVAGILREIAGEIPDGIDWVIRVDGHTDNLPLSGQGRYRDNWELSQARALSVVRYMVSFLGIPPNRLAANGFGQYQPVNSDDTPEARAQNRRIELKLTER